MAKETKKQTPKAPDSINKMIDDDDDIITLVTGDGKEIDFVEIAGIAYRGNFYAILQPVELLEGMNEGEAIVFKVTTNKNGTDSFDVELDETIIKAVYSEYEKLYDDAVSGSEGNEGK